MKCADISRALADDAGDLKAVRRHLETCPQCSRRFARDMEIEEALRNLDLDVVPADITAGVRASLSLLDRCRSAHDLVRKWVWAIVSLAALALLVIVMPILAGWLVKVYDLIDHYDLSQSINAAMPSAVYRIESLHLLCLTVAVLAWTAVHLWRETKSTIR